MSFFASLVLAALTSAEAIITVLNSQASASAHRWAEATAIVERDAAQGKPVQQFVVGITTSDKSLAADYLRIARPRIRALAEEKDNALAWYLLSVDKNDMTALKRAADGGNVQALNALGTILTQQAIAARPTETNRVEKLLRRSYGYFSMAAQKNDPNAFVNLGTCYLKGFGCAQNYSLAFDCFKAAAEAGHPEAMDYVSASYEYGNGVAKDLNASLRWRMRGRAARGDKAAAEWLRKVR